INGLGAEGTPIFEHALELFAADAELRSDPRLTTRAAIALCWIERCAESRTLVLRALAAARGQGAGSLLPYPLFLVAWAARRVGAWQEAVASATEGMTLARELGQWATMAQCLQELSTLSACRGAQAECRAQVEDGIAAADRVGAHYVTEILRAQI